MMARCLVTGGAGFIGSHIVEGLLAQGDHVSVLDNLSTGKKENLAHLGSKVRLITGDVRDQEAVREAVKGVDYVFHAAAVCAVLRSVEDPVETNEVNVTGTLNVLLAARDARVKRVIFSSSSSVYGDTQKFPTGENDPLNPQSPYAASKIMGEYYCRVFSAAYDLETVSLRYFNVFGPRQNPQSVYSNVIPIFIDHLLKGLRPEIHWDGKQSRDFIYVDNVVEANLRATKAKGVSGQVYNIGSREELSVLDIFKSVKDVLKTKDVQPIFGSKRAGDVRRTLADVSKAEKELGFTVQTPFRPGLEKTVQWFLDSGVLVSNRAVGERLT